MKKKPKFLLWLVVKLNDQSMQIEILQLTEGAKKAKGTTVVIDVFRAFSTACYLFAAGASRIIPVELVEEALRLKEQIPDAILLGERNEKKVEGFDFGNSPSHLAYHNFNGATIIMTTSSGTKGLMNATGADEILTGSFVNAGTIIRYLKGRNPQNISLVSMGYEGKDLPRKTHFWQNILEQFYWENLPIFIR